MLFREKKLCSSAIHTTRPPRSDVNEDTTTTIHLYCIAESPIERSCIVNISHNKIKPRRPQLSRERDTILCSGLDVQFEIQRFRGIDQVPTRTPISFAIYTDFYYKFKRKLRRKARYNLYLETYHLHLQYRTSTQYQKRLITDISWTP